MKYQSSSLFGPGGVFGGFFLLFFSALLGVSSPATGKVTDVHLTRQFNQGGRQMRVSYQFTTAKGEVINGALTRLSGRVPERGDPLAFYYLPSLPQVHASVPAGVPKNVLAVGSAILSVILIIVGGVATFSGGHS